MTDPMQTDLHSRIMNLPRGSYTSASNGWREENAYQLGHRDARHAAAELANETASELRSLRDALALAKSRIAELEGGSLAYLRTLIADDSYAMTFQTFGQYRTALLKAIDAARAALKEDSE